MKVKSLLALPGDPETISGGYGYDRRLVAELGLAGHGAEFLRLPDDFPLPASDSIDSAIDSLAGAPSDALLMIDGLALGALPAERLAALGRPIVGLVHHPLSRETGLAPAAAARLAASERAALAVATEVVVTSPATARALVEDFAVPVGKITVALPGTDPQPRAPGSWAMGSGAVPSILAVGTVIPRKGHDRLAAALGGLADRPWRLTIAGALDRDPAATAALMAAIDRAGIGGRVDLVGAVAPERLAELYAAADVFALLSAYEGYGMAFAEALACGLPIVACDGGAVSETVPPEAGLLVPPEDVDAARAALARLLDDPDLRRAKADGARAAGLALPGWDATAVIVAGVLTRIAGGAVGRGR